SATTTKTARIWDSARERRTTGAVPSPPAASWRTSESAGCIIVTTAPHRPRDFKPALNTCVPRAAWNDFLEPRDAILSVLADSCSGSRKEEWWFFQADGVRARHKPGAGSLPWSASVPADVDAIPVVVHRGFRDSAPRCAGSHPSASVSECARRPDG